MLLRCTSLVPLLPRASPLFFLNIRRSSSRPLLNFSLRKSTDGLRFHSRLPSGTDRRASRFSSLSLQPPPRELSVKEKRRLERESPSGMLKQRLDRCSKHGSVAEALQLYDEAKRDGVKLKIHHFNALLYLCSSAAGDLDAAKRGLEIFSEMVAADVDPNEAAFTSLARLAAAVEDPEMAFESVKQMKSFGIEPRLRSYGPALLGFGKKGDAERAYEVDAHMIESGVVAEEPELTALLEVSVRANRARKVYEMLHRIRATVRQVSESTAAVIEGWFRSEGAAEVGIENWDIGRVKEGIVKGGGGWHGQGWLGAGEWKVARTHINENGLCGCCGEKLVCIDIDPRETENFASSLARLAQKKEMKDHFTRFQEWLERHGPFDAVVDAANVSLINYKNMNFSQLNSIVNEMRQMSPSKKLPLVLLHTSRVTKGPAQQPNNRKLLDHWRSSGALYATPHGSNDDWYWLYAAVRFKCLLVTNDEMRDHLFQLLGSSFFSRWKEKHQVRLSVAKGGLKLHMPPPYSNVIQESESGRWHVPTIIGDDVESPRQWLCAARVRDNLHVRS